jgi:hypothetical protein
MPRLCTAIAVAIVLALGAGAPANSASAQQQKQKAGVQHVQQKQRAPRSRVIILDRDRMLNGPPLPPSSTQRNYYGPSPGVQGPMERVPLPAPLAQPPILR